MKTNKQRNNILLIIIAAIFLKACDNDVTQHIPQETINMEDVNAPYDFNYHTANDVQVTISVHVNGNDPVSGISFHVLTDHPESNGSLLGVGATDSEGIFNQIFQVPTYTDSLVIIGYMTTLTLPIANGEVTYEFGNHIRSERSTSFSYPDPTILREGIVFNYLSGYNSNGLPDSLDYEYVDPDFITRINVSLPEWSSVPATHPEYLAEGNQTNIHLLEEAVVSVTFVHEGAGYKNALGFYTYNYDDGPPESREALDLWLFFPNTSIPPLQAGDKITLGTFPAGTVIGWFLVANGWKPSSQIVTEGIRIVFSDPQYNTDAAGYKQHNVFLYDEIEDKYVVAFEDLQRPYGDEDFNDAVFYASATPAEAVSQGNVALIDPTPDSDNDGVADNFDEYPNDPLRAFTVHYPSEGSFGTLSFEDLWPDKGDYDFNDLIIDYNFIHVTNGNNRLVDVNAELVLKAIGAGYHNGFSIEMPFSESRIQDYSGDILSVQTNLNNSNAIINVFSDAFQIMPSGANQYVNTHPDDVYITPVTLTFSITLNASLHSRNMEYNPPYNPFLRIHGNEELEVHLPDYPATSFADISLFGTGDDDSVPGINRFYKTETNLPWAINVVSSWEYPKERTEISWGYLRFVPWAESGGVSFSKWHRKEPENVNETYIYSH